MAESSTQRLTPEEKKFRRKIGWSRAALYFERLWPRFWAVIAIIAFFLLISLGGIWPMLTEYQHWSVLIAFGVAFFVAVAFVLFTRLPSREDALRRLEEGSQVMHRPASAYEDKLSNANDAGETSAIWQAHRQRIQKDLERLHVSPPLPRTDKFDRIGLRAVLAMIVVVGLVLVGDAGRDRVWSAFRFTSVGDVTGVRFNAWVTPLPYTRRPPILIAEDSAATEAELKAAFEVPEQSSIFVRLGGSSDVELTLEYLDRSGARIGEPVSEAEDVSPDGGNQVKGILKLGTYQVRVLANGAELARWPFNIIADRSPEIAFTKDMEVTPRGAMKLFYSMADDYGVASAEAKLERMPLMPGDPKTAWARPNVLKGPRPPLERPPKILLRVPIKGAKDPSTWSFHELGSHPWAGMPVRMTLVARDHAGNVGKSEAKEIVLPERRFFNPLARAVLEQRRRLVFDARYRELVVRALDALTLFPEAFIRDKAVYLGMRSVMHRLKSDVGRKAIASAIEHLWHLALRIENGGGLSDAERRLKELQQKLAEAIQNGASQEEIQNLMQQLRQALAQFLNELAKQAQRQPQDQQQQNSPGQTMTGQDLQRMLDNLENMLRQGSKQNAQEMLSQLRNLLDRLQSGRMTRREDGQGQSRQMMQMMDQLGDLIGRQQRLMDDTFSAQRQGGQQQRQREGQEGRQQGQQGQGGQGQQQQGQGRLGQGQRQPGQGSGEEQGQNGRGGSGADQLLPDNLSRRQYGLGRRLNDLQQRLDRFGMQTPSELDGARRSMENAERALREGRLDQATQEQSRALEQLRSGTQSMAEQMMQRMRPSRVGRSGDAPLDPLGRPQRSEGPDLGTSVKIPDEIDAQRVREILELLRKRLGERFRPELELEYFERLLERF